MKELSIEEKATRYDQAIKVAKSKIKNDKDSVLYEDDVIEIFPELKESGEEKIRKEILSIVKSYRENCITEGNHRFDDCLTWLEKQGENHIVENNEMVYATSWILFQK